MKKKLLLVKMNKIKQKHFQIIKYIYAQKFNKQGFIKTRFLVRKRKLLDIHRLILKTGLLIYCIGEVSLKLRHVPIKQVQYCNWNIAYAFDQLGNNRTIRGNTLLLLTVVLLRALQFLPTIRSFLNIYYVKMKGPK